MKKTFLIFTVISLFTIISSEVNATDVGGIIYSDTTWNLGGSPYNVTSSLQVAEEATLTIEPGVVVNNASADQIQFWGGLLAIGTESSKIIFNALAMRSKPPASVPPLKDPM